MKRLLTLMCLMIPLIVGMTSCEDERLNSYERAIVGDYTSDDHSCHVRFYEDRWGDWEYRDGVSFIFKWEATSKRLFLRSETGEAVWYSYSFSRGGNLIIYDFDEFGDLILIPRYYNY